jgi:hypothetical protein
MAKYEITLTDGSTIVVEANSPEEATQIASRQIDEKYAAQPSGLSGPDLAAQREGQALEDRLAQQNQPAAPPPMDATTQATDIARGASRGMAPYAAAAGLGALAGAPFAGVGAPVGAAAGVGAVGLAQFVGDPVINAVNSFFGTQYTTPTEALNQLMDAAGMPKPETTAGRITEQAAATASGGFSGVGVGRAMVAGATPGTLTQRVGQTLAAAPMAQVASGATAGTAAGAAREAGAPPLVQLAAGLGGGVAGGVAGGMLGSRPGFRPGSANAPVLDQDFGTTSYLKLSIPTSRPGAAPMTYEDVARDTKTAARGGMGSQQAVDRLARAAPINKDAAAAAERLGIDVPPDVLMDHTQLKEAIGLTRSMPGTLASATWADAVERAATQADEAMALIDGSPNLAEVSKGALDTMNSAKTALETQAKELYNRVNAKLTGGAAPEAPAAAAPPKDAAPAGPVDVKNYLRGGMDTLYRNPSARDLQRLAAKTKTDQFRWVRDSDGNIYVGDANSNVHEAMLRGLKEIGVPLPGKYLDVHSFRRTNPDEAALGGFIKREGDKWEVNEVGREFTWKPFSGQTASTAKPAAPTPKAPPTVDLVNSRRLMNEVMRGLDDPSSLTPLEKKLMEMSSPGREKPPTYDAMMRLKNDIGQAVEKASGPYADMNTGILKRLYSALAEDQLYNVERIGGKQLRDDLRLANQTYAKQSALGKRIVSLFGDERDGSIAQKLLTTIKSGSKGDITGFNRIVAKLPADLRKKAVASAIAAAAREEKTNGFGFSKYVNLYQGLRRNSEVYKTVATTLGPDGDKFLRDLYEVSKRITDARANVKTTGQANQALVQGLMAEGVVEKVLRSTVGRQATMGGATAVGGVMAGPAAGAASAMLVNALSKSSKNGINAAGDLFASPEWQQLVVNISTENRVNTKFYNAAKNSKPFQRWTKAVGITDPDAWLRSVLASTIGIGLTSKNEDQPYMADQPYEAQAPQ